MKMPLTGRESSRARFDLSASVIRRWCRRACVELRAVVVLAGVKRVQVLDVVGVRAQPDRRRSRTVLGAASARPTCARSSTVTTLGQYSPSGWLSASPTSHMQIGGVCSRTRRRFPHVDTPCSTFALASIIHSCDPCFLPPCDVRGCQPTAAEKEHDATADNH